MMMDFNGNNRGYAFVTFGTKQEAKNAMKHLNNYEIRYVDTLLMALEVDNSGAVQWCRCRCMCTQAKVYHIHHFDSFLLYFCPGDEVV